MKGRLTEYQLLFDGDPQSQEPHLPGLIDPSKLQQYEAQRSGQNEASSGVGRGQVGAESGGGRTPKNDQIPKNGNGFSGSGEKHVEIVNKEPDFERNIPVDAPHTGIEGALLAVTEEGC